MSKIFSHGFLNEDWPASDMPKLTPEQEQEFDKQLRDDVREWANFILINNTKPVKHYGKEYQCVLFKSVDAANQFMAANPEWGLLCEIQTPSPCFGGVAIEYAIARLDDVGK